MTQREADAIARVIAQWTSGYSEYVCEDLSAAGLGFEFKPGGPDMRECPGGWPFSGIVATPNSVADIGISRHSDERPSG